ncbi:MAG: hypothetical protein RMI34_11415 [Chloroherpetonaceae bacterium]|nr:hypothetical protein [Chloroherpetonaceae bacterium]
MKKTLLFVSLCFPLALNAQKLELSGELDLEFRMGGSESNFITNEIPNEFRYPHAVINQFNAFFFSELAEKWTFNGRVQLDIWGSGRLNQPRITLAAVTYEPSQQFSASAGRLISPFGLYARRQLLSQNLFAAAPLMYGYFINISEKRGFWPIAGNTGAYDDGSSDVGVTTAYFGAYVTGASFNWIVIPNGMNLQVAITNAALASTLPNTNLANAAVVARVGIQPAIWWQQGVSISYGSFMNVDSVNAIARENNPLERYRQLLIGTDFIFAYLWFELSGELMLSQWSVPKFSDGQFIRVNQGSSRLQTYNLMNYGGYVDFKFEPPFLTGSYVAFRAERIAFEPFDDPITGARTYWDRGVTRLSAAIGYKLSRNVVLRAAYSDQRTDGDRRLDPDDWTFRALLIVLF